MQNCPKKKIKTVSCPKLPKCDGVYAKLDTDLKIPKTTESSLLYSGQPYNCGPTPTCLNTCIYRLPNIPAETYTVYDTTLNGIDLTTNLSPSNFKTGCKLK